MKQIDVAIGIVCRAGRILICQRRRQDTLGGFWEFPGGKREPDESLEQCLLRELTEELAISVQIRQAFDAIDYDYGTACVRLHPFLCDHLAGEPLPLASQRLAWVTPAELYDYPFPPANEGLIRELTRQMNADQRQAS